MDFCIQYSILRTEVFAFKYKPQSWHRGYYEKSLSSQKFYTDREPNQKGKISPTLGIIEEPNNSSGFPTKKKEILEIS